MLTRAYKAYIIMTDNQYREKQTEIDKTDEMLVKTIQEKIHETINKNWKKKMNVNEMQKAIDAALKTTYDEILRTKKNERKGKKQALIKEHTWVALQKKMKAGQG